MLKLRFLVFTIVLINISSYAQITAPKYSNEFLNIGVGARALAMSNVGVAFVNDVTAGYWNPAGLTSITNKYQIAYMHSEFFAGISKYDYASISTKPDANSTLALSYIRFGIDNIPDTRFLFDATGAINYNNIKYFSATDNAFLLSYARKNFKIKGLNVGANFKVVYRNVGDFANAWGFGLDAGAQYKWRNWMLGLMARDITSTYNMWSINSELLRNTFAQTNNDLPSNSVEVTLPKLIFGVAHQFNITQKIGLLAGLDADFTFDGKRNTLIKSSFTSIDPKLGIEADYLKVVFIRAGVGNVQQLTKDFSNEKYFMVQPNFGIGVKVFMLHIDYALTTLVGLSSESIYSNVVSLKVNLK
jgi:hypothetical protein